MAREGIRFELSSAFQKAVRQKETITVRGARVGVNGGVQEVDLTIQSIEEPEALRGMVMIVFSDVTAPPEKKRVRRARPGPADSVRNAELEQELRQLREDLQTTREEMQSSQEELKSTNEELTTSSSSSAHSARLKIPARAASAAPVSGSSSAGILRT